MTTLKPVVGPDGAPPLPGPSQGDNLGGIRDITDAGADDHPTIIACAVCLEPQGSPFAHLDRCCGDPDNMEVW